MEELDIKTAIQIAKILAAAPDERIPMILDVFSKAQVDINGLDELAEWRALDKQAALIDTDAFVTELTKGKELEDGEYRIRVPEFNHFCSTKGVSARYARKHLYESGMLRSSTDNGKINYTCPVQATDTKKTERCVCITPKNCILCYALQLSFQNSLLSPTEFQIVMHLLLTSRLLPVSFPSCCRGSSLSHPLNGAYSHLGSFPS